MKTYSKALRFLYGLEVFGMKFGLKGIRALLRTLDNPQDTFPTVHVAGTNGKGSTSAMLAAILTAAGYKTGLYTSPHLISFTERIRIDGKPIPPGDVLRLTTRIQREVRRLKSTYFEAVTAMAFKYFSDEGVDVAIIETGLGGRLDATNVLHPRVSVITNVSLEHTAILGRTLEKIVREKGGIIKHGVPCVTGIRSSRLLKSLRSIAEHRNTRVTTTAGVSVRLQASSLAGLKVDATVGVDRYPSLVVSLAGKYQLMNLKIVLQTIHVLKRQGEFMMEDRHVRNGLRNVRALSGIEGRISVAHRHPLVLVDVAHNPDAIRRLVEAVRELGMGNVFLVLGVVKDKDYRNMIRLLKPITRCAIITEASTSRARPAVDLADECVHQGIPVVDTVPNVSAAVKRAVKSVRGRDPILVTGSHYVVGEALASLRSRKFT